MDNKINKIVGILFIFIGIITYAIMGVIIYNEQSIINDGIKTTGTITGIYEDYTEVNYLVGDDYYNNRVSYTSSTNRIGDSLTLYYQKDDPNKIVLKQESTFLLIMLILPTVFFVIGMALILNILKKSLNRKKLKRPENYVEAEITSVDINERYMVNGRHPYKITCTYNGKNYVSDNILLDVEDIIYDNDIKKIPIYIDRMNTDKYYVDIDFIKKFK